MLLAAAMPQAPEAAAEALQQALLAAGWAFPGMQETRGFVGSNATRWHSLCRGDHAVMLSSAPAAGGGSYLRVDSTTQRSQFQCNPARGGTRGGTPWADVPLPVLNVPPGAVVVSTSMGGGMVGNGGAGATAGVRLRTGMGTVELMSRFAAQLAQAGWAPSQPLGSAGMGMQTFRLRAADGKEWFGALTAVAIPGSDVHDLASR
jgi:hypothetical protein